ncbi:MAG: methylmalonyl-CoA mutase [Chitinophagales bacterium]|nr:methylmalonyl-CoA mutase [Chitinophagales bacterium]
MAGEEKKFISDSGIEIERVYVPKDRLVEEPGVFPFTRGVHSEMYRSKLWTMRQYAGFSTAEESNKRYHYLLSQGVSGLSVAFDLPTQIGYDSDHPLADGEVGKVGVAIDSLVDMQTLFNGIKLEEVSTSMTINSTGYILLAFYIALAKQQGADLKKISGTIQNDILKEYAARGTYIYPPRPSMKIITDIFEYCNTEVPKWNTISISGYHIREAGSTAAQELAFTLANGKVYCEAAIAKGLDINQFGQRLSFFFNAHNNFFEEVAKFRAARRMWAKITKDLGATDARAQMLRFHTQTGGSTLTAQQPQNNIVRVSLQAMAAVLGGTQSLHTNGFDEALSLPTADAAKLALRTQQVIGFESGVTETVDPLAGSYFVEQMTDQLEEKAWQYITYIDSIGGAVSAVEKGFIQDEIAKASYDFQKKMELGQKVIVGVNKFVEPERNDTEILRIDDSIRALQTAKLAKLRAERNAEEVSKTLNAFKDATVEGKNIMPFVVNAVEAYCTLGEVADVLRGIYGEYQG